MRRLLVLDTGAVRPDRPFRFQDWEIDRADSAKAAEETLARHPVRVGLIELGRGDPPQWVESLLADHGSVRWIALVDQEMLQSERTRQLVARRCYDFHTRPIRTDQLQWSIGHAYGHSALTESTLRRGADSTEIFGVSPVMQQLRRTAERFAATDAPVTISGESGVGKEVVARYVYSQSKRREQPFIAINCAAIPADLLQTELFGYERGAFTGAHERKIGRIETAQGGTVFFDEIAELPLSQQPSILRFLEEGSITRIGGRKPIKVDVRIIAATNRDLEQGMSQGWFRRDLYHRLCVLNLRVPSLRERREDIALLAAKFVDDFSHDTGVRKVLDSRAQEALIGYDWPGNVRELRNRVRRAVLLSEDKTLRAADLGLGPATPAANARPLDLARIEAERSALEAALRQSRGNLSLAARVLGVSRMTLYRLMRRLDLGEKN